MAVEKVNGKEGAVTLKAADVEAVATSEVGQPEGVASLDSGTKLPEAQLPSSVATKTEVSAEETRAKAAEKKAQEEAEAAAASKAKVAEEAAITAATSKVKTEEEARKAEVNTEKERAETAEALKAPIASPTLTGTPAAPTAAAKTNTTQLATTAFIQTAKAEAESASVPVSAKGKASGVAELDGVGKLPEGELPSSVVSSSSTGGVPAWQASTKYAVNQLVQSSEVTYICLEAHESGSSFPGVGAKWAPVAGTAIEVSAPAPTGVAATDTANIQAALTAAAGGVCKITMPGTYAINATLQRPYNASVFLGPNCILEASAAIAGPVLSDSKTERSLRQSIVGGGVIDSNNKAQNALWCRYFQRGMTLGIVCKNSTHHDCILGDTAATATSDEAFFTSQFACDRTGFSVPAGGYSLWLQNCSDASGAPVTLTGQERGVRADLSDCKFFGFHAIGAAYPMNACFEDNGLLNEWHGCEADTPTPIEHKEATGSTASGTITDTAILSQHKGLVVTGSNIPANSYIGAVKPGESFILATNNGTELKPTAEVKGIKLMGTGWMLREPETRIIGGGAYISPTYGVDNGAYGVTNTSNAVNSLIVGLTVRGGSASYRFTRPLVGNLLNTSWVNLIQTYCVEYMTALTQLTSNHGTTLRLTNSVSGSYLVAENQEGKVVALINGEGRIFENTSPCTPGLLAYAHYAPSSSENYTTESTTLVAIDSTNLSVSFVAPPSGKVLVRLEGHIVNETGGDKVVWALVNHGETTQVGDAGIACDSNAAGIRPLTLLVTGLTSGETYHYDWAWAVSAGKAKQLVQAVKSPWTNAAAPATMEVWAA